MFRHSVLPLLLFCAVAGCSRTPSPASPAPTTDAVSAPTSVAAPAAPAASAETPIGSATDQKGLRAFIDPATGELRAPTQAEVEAEATQRRIQGVAAKTRVAAEEIKLPNGMTEVRVGKDAEVSETICIQKDGSLGACPPDKAAELRAKKPSTP